MNQIPISPLLLQKYLNSTCTKTEIDAVEKWYASLTGEQNYLETISGEHQLHLQMATYAYINARLKKQQKAFVWGVKAKWVAGIAASVVLLLISYLGYQFMTGSRISATGEPQGLINFQNNEPRIVLHALPDGSSVWMHSDAKITYPTEFKGNDRSVSFTGEGFFDVVPDKKHPFLVITGEMNIKVLGTRFTVKADARKKIFEISVLSGSVAVSAINNKADLKPVVLKPKQQAFFETMSGRLTTSAIPLQAKKEIFEPVTISFDGATMETVTEQLDQRFDAQIHLVDKGMNRCRLTADFEQQPLPVILNMLCTSLGATYTMSGKIILIEGAPCD